MQIEHNRSRTWHLSNTIKCNYGKSIMGITLVLLSFLPFCPSAHATGPYSFMSNTVIDQGTGLEWQKNDSGMEDTWQNALAYCEDLSLNSQNDWRLPNIRELKSLVDYNRYYPAIAPKIPCQSSSYWSSTSYANDTPTSAWSVFFGNGDDIWQIKTKSHHIRCVRAGLSRH